MNDDEQGEKTISQFSTGKNQASGPQELQKWLTQVLESPDPRDRVAVTGHRISHGVFGKIIVDLPGSEPQHLTDKYPAHTVIDAGTEAAANDAVFDIFTHLSGSARETLKP